MIVDVVVDKESRSSESVERTYTTFLIASESFAVDVGLVKELVRKKELLPLTEPLKDVKGFIELHSVRIPVLNTKKILALESSAVNEAIMIVIIDGYILGLMVDIDADLEIFSSCSTPKPLKGTEPLGAFVEGTLKLRDKVINILVLESLVSSENRAKLFASR